ncbi:MAG TPA: hypothetical protein VFY83_02225, partial [Anaerolineales bacterium]|nr:hypothetical protein [Anaerolineales bacterium]
MAEHTPSGIYLIVEFDWPSPMKPELLHKAKDLHQIVQNQTWIQEVVAASGGLGRGPSSIWIFRLENYSALDRLLRDRSNEISQAYVGLFSEMAN